MIKHIHMHLLVILFLMIPGLILAQDQKDKPAVTFEELYDEPFSINRLFIGFQPLYGDLFATNVNAGFGIEASYFLKDKFDFKASFRKTYSSSFFDINRDLALRNSNTNDKPQIYNYYELGGTYHIKDFDQDSKTKMVLYKKSFKGNRWASMVPLHAEIPCKVRKIYGARLGGIIWNSTADLNRALTKQKLTNADLVSLSGIPMPATYKDAAGLNKELSIFSNIHSTNLYVGGSMTWIRNVAVSFDKYDDGVNDGITTVFFDILFAPVLKLDPVTYKDNSQPVPSVMEYSTKAITTRTFGYRLGIDGKFNRTLSWSYGGEIGSRPSITGMGFYALIKISFPLFSTNLDYKVESFGK